MRRRLVVTGIAVVAAALAGACSSAGSKAAQDVTVTTCTADPAGGKPKVSGQIHNNSSKASTYIIHVRFVDPSGNQVGDGVATVGRVETGGTATWTATGTQSAHGPLTCPLSGVTRTVAP